MREERETNPRERKARMPNELKPQKSGGTYAPPCLMRRLPCPHRPRRLTLPCRCSLAAPCGTPSHPRSLAASRRTPSAPPCPTQPHLRLSTRNPSALRRPPWRPGGGEGEVVRSEEAGSLRPCQSRGCRGGSGRRWQGRGYK